MTIGGGTLTCATLVLFAVGESSPTSAQCAPSKCEGQLARPGGGTLGYSFVTKSRIYRRAHVEVYETCVENDGNRVIDFNWFIPGPHTFVPTGFACPNPRPKLTHMNAPTYDGCLYYGNNWTRDRATFFPHIDDQPRIDVENMHLRCVKLPIQMAAAQGGGDYDVAITALKEGIATDLEVFAPTNPENATETLVDLKAAVRMDLDPKSNERYIHSIAISALPFKESKPNLPRLRLIPEDKEMARRFYREFSDGFMRLQPEIKLAAEIPIPRSPKLDTIRFGVVDADNRPVATLFIPYLLSKNDNIRFGRNDAR
jgi:hypothetical protein